MVFKSFKAFTAVVLSTSLLFVSLSAGTGTTYASSSIQDAENVAPSRSNLQIINDNFDNYEYTFDENGESFKIIEQISTDLKEVHSQIYKKDNQGDYQLDENKITNIKTDGTVEITTTTSDEQIINESFQLDLSSINVVSSNKNDSLLTVNANPSPLTGWQWSRTDQYSSQIYSLTIAAIIAALGAYIPGATASFLAALANLIYLNNVTTVYYTVYVYFKYIVGTSLPRAELDNTYVYSDKARTNLLGTTSVETYTPGWGPE
ncbi:hypothetical protein [Paenibacillus sp. FSL R10-2736]|jgi:soluble P-type ATPase|uniref:hypothetical protein n=1 Tax=Paenibacillus sp. FSL R10-2736 TaxID=2954692 RepID=UPI0030F83999